jgi:serine/threonine protein kinase
MIADFDVARVMSRTASSRSNQSAGGPVCATTVGTPHWMAPEVINNDDKGYNPFIADVWSLGCTVFSMLSTDGHTPFKPMSNVVGLMFSIVSQGTSGNIVALKNDQNFLGCSEECRDFVSKCLSPCDRRPTSAQLLEHPWLLAADIDLHRVDAPAAAKSRGQAGAGGAASAGDAATSSMVMHRPSSLTASSGSSIQSSLATATTGSAATAQAEDVTQHIDGVTLGGDDLQ